MVIFQKDDSLCKQFKRWQEETKEEDFGLVRFLLIGICYFYFFIVCEIVGVVSVALTWTRRRQSGQNCYMEERGEYGKKKKTQNLFFLGKNETGCENSWSRKFNRAKESDEKRRERRRKQEVHYCSRLFFLPFKLLFRIEVVAKVAVFQIRKLVRGVGGISDGPISPTFYSFRGKNMSLTPCFPPFFKKKQIQIRVAV